MMYALRQRGGINDILSWCITGSHDRTRPNGGFLCREGVRHENVFLDHKNHQIHSTSIRIYAHCIDIVPTLILLSF